MVDPLDIELKFRTDRHGQKICYSPECPEVKGQGENEDVAATNFWKMFNRWCAQKEDVMNRKTA